MGPNENFVARVSHAPLIYFTQMKHFRANLIASISSIWLVSTSVPTPTARGNDWAQWRGPNRDGISSETGWLSTWPAEGPKKLWEGSVGIGYSSCAVSKGQVYTMGNVAENDNVLCFDAENGKLKWKHEYPCL